MHAGGGGVGCSPSHCTNFRKAEDPWSWAVCALPVTAAEGSGGVGGWGPCSSSITFYGEEPNLNFS
jgi:hypothetical protein